MTMTTKRLRSVLLVDDEPEIRDILREILDEHDCRVLEANNGKEAFQISRTEKIDILITDLLMPEQEGIETIRQFRNVDPDVKIIAMSGAPEPIYLHMARMLGADATLSKPLNLTAVSSILRRMLKRAPVA